MATEKEPEPKSGTIAGMTRVRQITLIAIVLAALLILMATCVGAQNADQFMPPPPPPPVTQVVVTQVAPTGTQEPTLTPLPTWTPVPTNTPQPLVDLPNQQRAYAEYRIYHLLYEYRVCYRHYIQPPPTPLPTPTPGATPVYRGSNPSEPWRDDPRFAHLRPTPTPTPTPFPNAKVEHLPAPYGLTDRQIDDHALRDLGGATRWLIERYSRGDCAESTHYAAFTGRTVFLTNYSRK